MTTTPTAIDLLDASTVTRMLRSDPSLATVDVADVQIEPVGTGQLAGSYRLSLEYSAGSGPSTVVAKLPSSDPSSRETGRATGAYLREVRFYESIAELVTVRRPGCFHASIDESTHDFALLLEDLGPARMADQLVGCDLADAELAVREAAALHGSSWGRPEVVGMDFLPVRPTWEFLASMLPGAIDPFLARFENHFEEEQSAAIRQVAEVAARWLTTLDAHRCLWHGDYRLDNMLFDGQDGAVPLTVVDWQSVAAAPGVIDVSYFLGTSVDTELRRAREDELVRGYHEVLLEHGVEDYSFETCWLEYRAHAVAGLVMLVPISMGVQQTERGDAMFGSMIRRIADQVIDHDSFAAVTELVP